MDGKMGPEGPEFVDPDDDSTAYEPLYGFSKLRQLYEKAEPQYVGRCTVPTLWDRKAETIVSNESAEIIRMLYTEFDAFVSEELREENKPLLPTNLREQIDDMNEWVYHRINNGV